MMIENKVVALAAVVFAGACSYAHVGSGQVAVVRTPDGVDSKVYGPGDWHIGMWDKPTYYTVRSQEREEQLDVLASNGLRIDLDASIRYHIAANEAVQLDQELGEDYYSVLLGPTLHSQARRVVGRFQPEEIYSSQRELIERQIREGVETAIKGRHIVLEAVLIRSVKLPDSIQTAINDKLTEEQHALKMKYVLEQAESEQQQKLMEVKAEAEREQIKQQSEAETTRVAAQAAADAARIGADAAADAKRADGKATADYEQLVQRYLTPQVLRMQEIEATKALAASPNAKILYLGAGTGAGSTLLDLRGLSQAAASR